MGRKQRVRNNVSVNVTVEQQPRKLFAEIAPRSIAAQRASVVSRPRLKTDSNDRRSDAMAYVTARRTPPNLLCRRAGRDRVAAGAEVTTVALHACVGAKAPHGAAHDRRIDAIVEADVLEIRRILVQRDRTTTELAALEDLTARGTIATRARRKRP